MEEFRVTHLALAPPLLVAMAKNDDVTGGCDLSSLEEVVCGGAPLGKDVISAFLARFPRVAILQVCVIVLDSMNVKTQFQPHINII